MLAREVTLRLSAFGVPVSITAPRGLRDEVNALLPPGARPTDHDEPLGRFRLSRAGRDRFVIDDGTGELEVDQLAMALDVLDSRIRGVVALNAPDHIFVHAGVVTLGTAALLLPGRSFAGKSTLVAALVEHGATYYSDEFAPLDAEGRVYPYARPLSLRATAHAAAREIPAKALGAVGSEPARVAVIVLTQYSPGAAISLAEISRGQGAMELLANSVPAKTRSVETLQAARCAASAAAVFRGDRGDASIAAVELRDLLERYA